MEKGYPVGIIYYFFEQTGNYTHLRCKNHNAVAVYIWLVKFYYNKCYMPVFSVFMFASSIT